MQKKRESKRKKNFFAKAVFSTVISCGIGYAFYKLPTLFADKFYYYSTKMQSNKNDNKE